MLTAVMMTASLPAAATIQVGKNIIHFLPGEQPRIDVPVRNPDDETRYIEVEVLEVRNPGTDAETRTPVIDARRVDFLVTPNRFILPPGGKQIVRFVNTGGHGEEERIFRVNLKPVPPPAEATRTAIRVVVAYQVLAIIEPAERASDLAVERIGNSLTVANLGNTNALFRNGVQCMSEEDLRDLPEGRCRSLQARRVHPGNTWTLDLPYNAPVEFIVSEAGRARRQRY
jgi:P pilus assembly chaperone PapD